MKPPSRSSDRQPSIENRQFFKRVYAVVRTIPRGKVLTYGQIATLLGSPYMARQVGWAMHGCPKGLPWQRVVGAGGKILVNSLSVGDGALLQRRLLELEGVRYVGQRVDMAAHQFVPPGMKHIKKRRTTRRRPASASLRSRERISVRAAPGDPRRSTE
jgi:methylated-DNA-protein-cysteine methyltransferase-like protein